MDAKRLDSNASSGAFHLAMILTATSEPPASTDSQHLVTLAVNPPSSLSEPRGRLLVCQRMVP